MLAVIEWDYFLDENLLNCFCKARYELDTFIGPLHDPVTWCGINYAGTQVTQWDFQKKGNSGWSGTSSFV